MHADAGAVVAAVGHHHGHPRQEQLVGHVLGHARVVWQLPEPERGEVRRRGRHDEQRFARERAGVHASSRRSLRKWVAHEMQGS